MRFALVIPIAVMLAGCGADKPAQQMAGAGGPPATPVSVVAAVREVLPVEVRAVGTVEPFHTVQIKSQVAGNLVGVRFTEGGFVQQGDLLFQIDPRPYQEALAPGGGGRVQGPGAASPGPGQSRPRPGSAEDRRSRREALSRNSSNKASPLRASTTRCAPPSKRRASRCAPTRRPSRAPAHRSKATARPPTGPSSISPTARSTRPSRDAPATSWCMPATSSRPTATPRWW